MSHGTYFLILFIFASSPDKAPAPPVAEFSTLANCNQAGQDAKSLLAGQNVNSMFLCEAK